MYKIVLLSILFFLHSLSVLAENGSPTEGSITNEFVVESQMKADILSMLAKFTTYIKNDYIVVDEPNILGEKLGCFRGENTMSSREAGVRPNADLSMICAFLVKYGKGKVELPEYVSWEDLDSMALQSLRFAYSTHKANKLKACSDGKYWGSLSVEDYVWESSLWAMSVAYSAFFQWDKLKIGEKQYIYQLLKAECNYELERTIEASFEGDTKAEENGWEADVLAATLGLFPNDELAPLWFNKLREYAINSFSHPDDEFNNTIIDPEYDDVTVQQLYRGQNIFEDYTLQNHNYFHTSYQNVVIQELGEAALALRLFQRELNDTEKWKTNALMHNCDEIMKNVLNWLALADGELAMPNGNDWSLFLYDQITSYTTNACFLGDSDALMLENLAYKMIKARQTTTDDGSWLLRPDVGARRMGVEGHRVMMTWLMHEVMPTETMKPSEWDEFNKRYCEARVFETQDIVRASSDERFTCFSWSEGIKSYTGYIASNSVDKNKIIVPFKKYNTGNYLGWYDVEGCSINATPVDYRFGLVENSYTMNGELNINDESLNHRFAIFSSPGNAVTYIDYVVANKDVNILTEKGGLMGISIDDFTNTQRTLYSDAGSKDYNKDTEDYVVSGCNWINIDNTVGVVTNGEKDIFMGEVENNNSIYTAQLSSLYSKKNRTVKKGDLVDKRMITYYSNINSETTAQISSHNYQLFLPDGWNGGVVTDPDSTRYFFISNFSGQQACNVENVKTSLGAPVFRYKTVISESGSTATFLLEENHSFMDVLSFFLIGNGLIAEQLSDNHNSISIENILDYDNEVTIYAVVDGEVVNEKTVLLAKQRVSVTTQGDKIVIMSEDITGIEKSENRKTQWNEMDRAYDLSGRRCFNTKSPIYIYNNRKIVGSYGSR